LRHAGGDLVHVGDRRAPALGDSLQRAIEITDEATAYYPVYYMINCAHPSHFEHVLEGKGSWRERIRGLRANASKRSPAELDECTDLDDGDPHELGAQYRQVRELLRYRPPACGADLPGAGGLIGLAKRLS